MAIHTSKKAKAIPKSKTSLLSRLKWLIPTLAILLYANTLSHDYTQDDAIVIYDNMYTTAGVEGIPGLLKYDTFRGFFKTEGKAKLVSGGRYRPLTPVMFAVEYQLFGKRPWVGHFINVLLYALLGMVVFFTLRRMLTGLLEADASSMIALMAALLYVAHPIHTEAVANIKGRDEIVAMLTSVSALWLTLKYIDGGKAKHIISAAVVFFLGLMSKENTITFLAVIPVAVYLFRRQDWKRVAAPWMALVVSTGVFLAIRTAVLGFDMGGTPMELMNNPFLELEAGRYVPLDFAEKMATITYTLGKYIALLVYPHPLTHDYYPRHIELMDWSDIKVLGSLLLYILLGVIALLSIRKRPIITFSIFYFIATLSIVSNIIFPIGTNMSERFMFMPSLGFSLLCAYGLWQFVGKRLSPNMAYGTLAVILLLYSGKTVTRNMVWQDDFTLFTTDVHTSTNSAKILNAAGGALTTEAAKLPDGPKKTAMLKEATVHLSRALEVHPGYKNAALILGNAEYYLGDYAAAVGAYERALQIAPGYTEAETNLAVALREAGKYAGEKEGNLQKAVNYLKRSLQLSPDDLETVRLLGVASGMSGDHTAAIGYFERIVAAKRNADSVRNLAKAYGASGDEAKAQQLMGEADQLAKEE